MRNDWELYESHPRFDDALKALNKAWDAAIRLAPELPATDRAQMAEKHVYGVMKLWSDVGAMDSEPVWHLKDRVRAHFGTDGNWI